MSRVYTSLCLDDVADLDQVPRVHESSAEDRLSMHITIADCALSLWSHDPDKLRALAATLRRGADALEQANAAIVKVAVTMALVLVASSVHAADRRPLTALVAASVADAVTTELAIARVPGAYESNPLLSGSALRREVSKAACTAGLVWGLARLSSSHPKLAAALAWTATGSLAALAAHNAAIGGR